MPASWAATEMTNTGASSGTSSLRLATADTSCGRERRGDLWPRIGRLRCGELLQRLAGIGFELGRDRHLDGDEQVAGLAFRVDAAATDPQRAAGRRTRRDLQRHRAIQG